MEPKEAQNAEQLTRFESAVLANAKEHAQDMLAMASAEQKAALAAAKAEAAAKLKQTIEAEKMRTRAGIAPKAEQELRQELLLFRRTLCDRFFENIKQQLAAFTASGEYGTFLLNLAKRFVALHPGEATLYLRAADLAHKEALTTVCAAVEADDSIRLGGLKFKQGQRMYNETLDARLALEQEAFLQYCGLNI